MCSLCKMDSADLNRFRTRQGAVEVDDFYKEVDYTPRKKKKAQRPPRIKGVKKSSCPGNDGNAHVYLWTTDMSYLYLPSTLDKMFEDYFGFPKNEYEVCVGCLRHNRTQHTKRYEKIKERKWNKMNDFPTGEPVPMWFQARKGLIKYKNFTWERYDEEFAKIRDDYMISRGFPYYLWWR